MTKWESSRSVFFLLSFGIFNLFLFFAPSNERNPFPSPVRISRDQEPRKNARENEKKLNKQGGEKIVDFDQSLDVELVVQATPCEPKMRLLIAIKSLPTSLTRRNAIRETWGSIENFKSKCLKNR